MLSTTSGQPMTIVTLLIISNNKHSDSSGASVGAGSAEHLTESRDGHVRSRDLKHQSQAAQRVMWSITLTTLLYQLITPAHDSPGPPAVLLPYHSHLRRRRSTANGTGQHLYSYILWNKRYQKLVHSFSLLSLNTEFIKHQSSGWGLVAVKINWVRRIFLSYATQTQPIHRFSWLFSRTKKFFFLLFSFLS